MSKKLKFSEPNFVLVINRKDLNIPLMDWFQGIPAGTIRAFCQQHAIKVKKIGNTCELVGPRDRLQRCIEWLHWCQVPSSLVRPRK